MAKLRPMITMLKKVYGDTLLVGAEVGVYRGDNAVQILSSLNIRRLYLIDNYDSAFISNLPDVPGAKASASDRLLPYAQVRWIYEHSHSAADQIPELLDFVYIDANHTYDNVSWDIEAYRHKVKPGGYLGGHDYVNMVKKQHFEVKRAVDDKVKQYSWKLYVTGIKNKAGDWWVQL